MIVRVGWYEPKKFWLRQFLCKILVTQKTNKIAISCLLWLDHFRKLVKFQITKNVWNYKFGGDRKIFYVQFWILSAEWWDWAKLKRYKKISMKIKSRDYTEHKSSLNLIFLIFWLKSARSRLDFLDVRKYLFIYKPFSQFSFSKSLRIMSGDAEYTEFKLWKF